MTTKTPSRQEQTDGYRDSPAVTVAQLFTRISEVSSLPAVALRIIEVANHRDSCAADLYEAVRRDVGLAMKIMRTVNSSYYSLNNRVADLQLAITLLGFEYVRNLALTTYVAQLFLGNTGHGRYRREGLWNHLIGTGAVAGLIADACGKVPPREAYLAGLFHDVGFVLLDQYLHKPFCQLVDAVAEDVPICDLECELLGFHHAELGAFVASKWDLPEQLTAAIRYHHAPEQYDGPHRDMVYVVTLANVLCSLRGLTSLGVRHPQMPPWVVFSSLGLTTRQVSRIWEHIDRVIAQADVMALTRGQTP